MDLLEQNGPSTFEKASRIPARSAQNDDDSDYEFADHHKSSENISIEVKEKTTAEVANKYVDPHNNVSEEDLSIQTSNKPRPNIGVSRRAKGTSLNTDSSSRSPSTPEYVNEKIFPTRRLPEPSSTNETQPSCTKSENVRSEEPSISLPKMTIEKAIDSPNSSREETPSQWKICSCSSKTA